MDSWIALGKEDASTRITGGEVRAGKGWMRGIGAQHAMLEIVRVEAQIADRVCRASEEVAHLVDRSLDVKVQDCIDDQRVI